MLDHTSRPTTWTRRRGARAIALVLGSCLGSLWVVGPGLAQAARAAEARHDANERRFIREGMAEGEVLARIGRPDHEALIRQQRGEPEEKTWSYLPAPRDPQTLTMITLRAGTVVAVERRIQR
jgi:hypothetical protein